MKFFDRIRKDIRVIFERDPAAKSVLEVILCYSGLHAIWLHRISHALFTRGWIVSARLVSNFCRFLTGIEIHPGATIGDGLFIDHGTGIVIGETAELGKNVTLYQGVTLGGTGKEKGKRHPTIGNNVVVATGAKVLGSFNEEDYRKALRDICKERGYDPNNPKICAEIMEELDVDLNHDLLPDPEREMMEVALRQIQRLEQRVDELETQLAAARAEISAEALRTSTLEVSLSEHKVDLKKS